MACAAPAYSSTGHWFLLVVVVGFIGSIFFSLYHLCLDGYLKNLNVGWLPTVSTYSKSLLKVVLLKVDFEIRCFYFSDKNFYLR